MRRGLVPLALGLIPRAVLVVGFLLVPASAAHAATVSISGTTLSYAGEGIADEVGIRRGLASESDTIRVVRTGGMASVTAGAGCTQFDPGVEVRCAGANGLTRVVVNTFGGDDEMDFSDLGYTAEAHLGTGDDLANTVDEDRPFNLDFHGDEGADHLFGSKGNDILDGGADGDLIQGRGGADDVFGGPGIDLIDYYNEPSRTGRVKVTLDDVRDDGNPEANELDNVHSDIEDVAGTVGDDVLQGSGAGNLLDGHEGSDQITGAGGADLLYGGSGNDTLNSRDGLAERVDCGADTDSATIDDTDTTSGCETVDSSAALIDADGDGSPKSQDCNDANNQIKPGALDVPDNGVDENCDGADAVDLDRDRDGSNRPQDCDDTNAAIRPGAVEIRGNKIDEDCSGADASLLKVQVGVSFAVVAVGLRSRFTKLTVTGLKSGDKVKLSCPTRRCPIRAKTLTAHSKVALAKYAKAALLRGTVVRIVVSRKGYASATIRLTMGRPGKRPAVKKS